ncbi:MAG: hypothetical protein U1E63_05485 [Burkholderiales bacterium]
MHLPFPLVCRVVLFAFFDRLSPRRQRTYLASDAIVAVALPSGRATAPVVAALRAALIAENRRDTERAGQALLDELCARLGVPPLRVKVYARRPQISGGELHGLYEPSNDATPCKVSVWMRTAQRKQVVAFKTFLRTLIHELCHHLDYELYRLPETFHTEGFYKRESDLVQKVLAEEMEQGKLGI